MSINIPAETPDESTNPISVEEFERLHPAMLGAIRKAVREEPARTVIGTVGDDRRSHLSSLDLRGIGIEVGRQLSARDMTTEVMGSILEHINQAADRLSTEIQELRSELIREHVETVGGGCHGSIHRIESIAHILTSLLCAGLLILPLGRKALKRNTSEKQSALTNA